MPSLAQHQSNDYVKLLLIGDAKTGKTGSLVSLLKAGYRLFILDLDNLLDFFKYRVLKQCPELIDKVNFISLRDKYRGTSLGTKIDGKPRAWIKSLELLNQWKDEDTDYGVPAKWGPDTILVIDSLSRWSDMAYDFHESIIPAGKKTGEYDGRAVYGNAQDDMEKQLASLTSKGFKTNVILIGHGTYMIVENKVKIFPNGIGQKLSPKIPTYFPNYVMYKQEGDKRVIQLNSEATISLSNGNPDVLHGTLPVDTGLATFFSALKAAPSEQTPPRDKPTTLTLQRRTA